MCTSYRDNRKRRKGQKDSGSSTIVTKKIKVACNDTM
jgi:hypothetical protein